MKEWVPVCPRKLQTALALLLIGCAKKEAASTSKIAFSAPERVTIRGYAADAMEPSLSPDGNTLFFNDSNAPGRDTNLHFASRIDELTFQYQGPIAGANSTALDAVASMDDVGELFFVSTRSYEQTLSTIFEGSFAAGSVASPSLVEGISRHVPGEIQFDAAIRPDGTALYFVDGQFSNTPLPDTADLALAARGANGFARSVDNAQTFAQVNTAALEYAPCISRDDRELFFTRSAHGRSQLYRSTRNGSDSPFLAPSLIDEVKSGTAEGPALSADERSLYFHQLDGGLFAIFRIRRLQ
jgi:Tol biopolymer transport system component